VLLVEHRRRQHQPDGFEVVGLLQLPG
jgi:hypothetical protein